MKIEVYIPPHETEVINKIIELKAKRRLSSYVVELFKYEKECITEDKVIELIKKYSSSNFSNNSSIEESIKSILGGI